MKNRKGENQKHEIETSMKVRAHSWKRSMQLTHRKKARESTKITRIPKREMKIYRYTSY